MISMKKRPRHEKTANSFTTAISFKRSAAKLTIVVTDAKTVGRHTLMRPLIMAWWVVSCRGASSKQAAMI